jgi:hypothetical protein
VSCLDFMLNVTYLADFDVSNTTRSKPCFRNKLCWSQSIFSLMNVLTLFDSCFGHLRILSTSILILQSITIETHSTIHRFVRTACYSHAVDIMNSSRSFDLFSLRFVIIVANRAVQHILIQMSSIVLTFLHISMMIICLGISCLRFKSADI